MTDEKVFCVGCKHIRTREDETRTNNPDGFVCINEDVWRGKSDSPVENYIDVFDVNAELDCKDFQPMVKKSSLLTAFFGGIGSFAGNLFAKSKTDG